MWLTDEIKEKLEAEGWVVECESPLEIRNDELDSFATRYAAEWLIDSIINENPDTLRINKLQSLTKGYGGGWILRESNFARGMRLHETTHEGATPDVREAIDNYEEE
jgi:hypothetical protein